MSPSVLSAQPVLGHGSEAAPEAPFPLPAVDLSDDASRRVVVAQGTPELYHGHPTTLLLPDGRTLFCVWTIDHGGPCGWLKRSDDGGRTWGPPLSLPENWRSVRNCPTIFRLPDPAGRYRLFVFAGQGPDGCMHLAWSDDEGAAWSPMRTTGLRCVMPFCAVLPARGGKRLVGLTNIRRRADEPPDERSNILAQSHSDDGGFTWSPWKAILDDPRYKYCEPWVTVSPAGDEWLCLIRENRRATSWFMTSRDEGAAWSAAAPLPVGLAGDRHVARYAPDGRLVAVFRDRAASSATHGHFVAWVGRYDDLPAGRDAGYRIKLLHSHHPNRFDCGYPGLECLPDGTFVATTYIQYRPGPEKNSIVSVRFRLDETDRLLQAVHAP